MVLKHKNIIILIIATILSIFTIHILAVFALLAFLIFIIICHIQKLNLKCKKCKKIFTLRLVETKILSSNYIEKEIKNKKKHIKKAFYVGEKKNTYKCENCGHTTSKITKYKDKI